MHISNVFSIKDSRLILAALFPIVLETDSDWPTLSPMAKVKGLVLPALVFPQRSGRAQSLFPDQFQEGNKERQESASRLG